MVVGELRVSIAVHGHNQRCMNIPKGLLRAMPAAWLK